MVLGYLLLGAVSLPPTIWSLSQRSESNPASGIPLPTYLEANDDNQDVVLEWVDAVPDSVRSIAEEGFWLPVAERIENIIRFPNVRAGDSPPPPMAFPLADSELFRQLRQPLEFPMELLLPGGTLPFIHFASDSSGGHSYDKLLVDLGLFETYRTMNKAGLKEQFRGCDDPSDSLYMIPRFLGFGIFQLTLSGSQKHMEMWHDFLSALPLETAQAYAKLFEEAQRKQEERKKD